MTINTTGKLPFNPIPKIQVPIPSPIKEEPPHKIRKVRSIDTVPNVYTNKLCDLIGVRVTADLLGYSPNLIRQEEVRKAVEIAAKYEYEERTKVAKEPNALLLIQAPISIITQLENWVNQNGYSSTFIQL